MTTITVTTECGVEKDFESKSKAEDGVDTHVALCEECTDDSVTMETDGVETDGGTAIATPDESTIETSEEFVTEIAGVPPAFVVDMGRGGSSKPYITKEGLNYIANKQGLQVRAEPIAPSWEDNDVVAYRGIVVDDNDGRWEDVGTAHRGKETIGDQNLDELASTRATNRALRLATGMGMTSLEEMADGAGNAVVEDAEEVEAEVVE